MISQFGIFRSGASFAKHSAIRRFHTSRTYKKSCDPLRVLFCGADEFSIASLRALNAERLSKPSTGIDSIDVVCRPGKRTGRGRKNITHPPIRVAAQDLGLCVHEIDTFTQWQPPQDINLIIAVSFGLLVPPRILAAAKYGGLNLHPSMLPDLRGAAPLHHTLLKRRTHTGVSVQTLHPTKFDHGTILAQTAFPGIPIPANFSPRDLGQLLAPRGADLLVQVIRDRKFVSPLESVEHSEAQLKELTGGGGLAHAPKITADDRRIDWTAGLSNADVLLRSQVLGRLWDDTTYAEATGTDKKKRITYQSWVSGGAEGSPLKIQIGERLTVAGKDDSEGREQGKVRSVQILSKGTLADIAQSFGTICARDFTIDGGLKDGGGQELARDITRHRKDILWRSS